MCSLTAKDVEEILVKFLGKEPEGISSFVTVPKSEEELGYLGNHWTLIVSFFSEPGNGRIRDEKFFVKSHKVNGKENYFLSKCGVFQKEVDFYRILVEEIRETVGEPIWCPKFFYSKVGILVLEDLSEKGFEIASGGVSLDEAHVEAALTTLARFHASFLLLEKKQSYSLISRFPHLFREILYDPDQPNSPSAKWISWQIQDLVIGIDWLKNYSEEEKKFIKENFAREIMRIYDLNKQNNKYKQVLTHGDVWKNNFMFRYSGGVPRDCRLVDFQFFRYAPPAHDVMHLIHFATRKTLRDERKNFFLEFYYDSLSREFETRGHRVQEVLTWEEFLESCVVYKELAIIQSLLSLHYILGTVSIRMENDNYQKHEEYLSRHRKNYMRELFAKESYTEKVEEILRELIDGYILKKQ